MKLLVFLALLITLSNGYILSIDYGTESLTIGIVRPGRPVDIVLNEQSKRKTPNVLAFSPREEERFLGENALAVCCLLKISHNIPFIHCESH